MKKVLSLSFCLLILGCSKIQQQGISPSEQQFIQDYLKQTENKLLTSLANLSAEQWTFKPDNDRWSIAECAEHISLAEDRLMTNILKKLEESEPALEKVKSKEELEKADQEILNFVRNRSNKLQAAPVIRPSNKWSDKAEFIAHFKQQRKETRLKINAIKQPLRAYFMIDPAGHELDLYQWLLIIASHTERHLKQIDEVKSAATFPSA